MLFHASTTYDDWARNKSLPHVTIPIGRRQWLVSGIFLPYASQYWIFESVHQESDRTSWRTRRDRWRKTVIWAAWRARRKLDWFQDESGIGLGFWGKIHSSLWKLCHSEKLKSGTLTYKPVSFQIVFEAEVDSWESDVGLDNIKFTDFDDLTAAQQESCPHTDVGNAENEDNADEPAVK